MPHGVLDGTMIYISKEEKLRIGRFFLRGVSISLKSWAIPVAEIFAWCQFVLPLNQQARVLVVMSHATADMRQER